MKVYKNFVLIWTVIYLFIAFVGRFTSSNKEYFPFFRWSLYSKTPNVIESPTVLVTKYNSEVYLTPKNILHLSAKHKIASVDMNLNVVNFYNKFKNNSDNLKLLRNTSLLKSLPKNSEFKLIVNKIDLTQKDLKQQNVEEILVFKNDQFYVLKR